MDKCTTGQASAQIRVCRRQPHTYGNRNFRASVLYRTAWSGAVEYAGNRDVLVASGICSAEQLDCLTGQKRVYDLGDGRTVTVKRLSGYGFEVFLSNEEVLSRARAQAGFGSFMEKALAPVEVE